MCKCAKQRGMCLWKADVGNSSCLRLSHSVWPVPFVFSPRRNQWRSARAGHSIGSSFHLSLGLFFALVRICRSRVIISPFVRAQQKEVSHVKCVRVGELILIYMKKDAGVGINFSVRRGSVSKGSAFQYANALIFTCRVVVFFFQNVSCFLKKKNSVYEEHTNVFIVISQGHIILPTSNDNSFHLLSFSPSTDWAHPATGGAPL